MLEKYESKQVRLRRGAGEIYASLSDFANFTPLVEGKVEDWRVEGDECSFRVKGLSMTLRIVERIEPTLVKIVSADSSPVGFTFWVQLHPVAADDTRLRLTLHVEMNVMIKMMVGGRIQPALDEIAASISRIFG